MIFKGSGGDIKSKKLQAQKLIGQGKYDEALELLLELAKSTSDPEIFNSIGDLYIRKQNHEKALEYLEKAYRMYKEQDFREIAVSVAKKILRLDKERHDVYLDLIQMELESGNVDRALDWALEYIKLPNIDAVYLGKLFNLINEFANVIQEHTEQASKFERLFMRVQELAESLAMLSLESGIEFAQPQEFYERGDVGGFGGFFGEPLEEGTAVSKRPKKKEEKEEVEKIEFIEKEEFEEEPKTFITSSGFADFLGVPPSEQQKPVPQEFKSSEEKIVFEEEEEIPVEQISEKTLVVEETPITEGKGTILEPPEEIEKMSFKPPVEEFKTVVEEVPEEVEEIRKEWESTLKKATEKKSEKPLREEGEELEREMAVKDFLETVTPPSKKEKFEEKRVERLEPQLEERDLITTQKKLDEKLQPIEKKPQKIEEKREVKEFETSKKFVSEPQVEKRPAAKPSPKVGAELALKKSIEDVEAREKYEYLLRILKELKEDILSLEEWPYPSDPPFEVAKEYYEMKLYQPAVEEFQKLLGDPRYRLQSMIFLGKIFYEKGDLELAEVILKKAIEEVGTLDRDYIEAYYYLALTLESMKRYHEAKELYTNVYVFDSRFKDVEQKIKLLRSMGI